MWVAFGAFLWGLYKIAGRLADGLVGAANRLVDQMIRQNDALERQATAVEGISTRLDLLTSIEEALAEQRVTLAAISHNQSEVKKDVERLVDRDRDRDK